MSIGTILFSVGNFHTNCISKVPSKVKQLSNLWQTQLLIINNLPIFCCLHFYCTGSRFSSLAFRFKHQFISRFIIVLYIAIQYSIFYGIFNIAHRPAGLSRLNISMIISPVMGGCQVRMRSFSSTASMRWRTSSKFSR